MLTRKLIARGLSVSAVTAAVIMVTALLRAPLAPGQSEQSLKGRPKDSSGTVPIFPQGKWDCPPPKPASYLSASPREEEARPRLQPQPFQLQRAQGFQLRCAERAVRDDHPFAIWDGTTDPRAMDYLADLKPAASVMVVPPLFFDKQSVEAGWPVHQKIYEEHVRLGIEFIPINDLERDGIDMPLAEFDAAVGKAVKTFPKMKTIMIGCEADGGCGPKVSRRPRDYALRVRVAYRAVKAVRQSCRVAVGGTGGNAKSYGPRPQEGVLGNPLSNPGYFDAVFGELERLETIEKNPQSYDWKANPLGLSKEEFKLVFSPDAYQKYQDIHHISLFVSDHKKYRDPEHLGVVRAVKALLYDYGYRDTEIWITQAGTHSGTIKSKFLAGPPQTQREQAGSLVKQFLVYRSWGVKRIFWTSTVEMDWPEEFPGPLGAPGNPQHFFSLVGLVHNGKGQGDPGHGVRKLSFHTYRFLVEKLGRGDWDHLELVRDDGAVVFRLRVDGKPVYVAWREPATPGPFGPLPPLLGQAGGPSGSVSLAIDGKAARVTSLIPVEKQGKEIRGDRPVFPSRRIETVDSRVTLELSEEPVLVEPISHAPANPSPQQKARAHPQNETEAAGPNGTGTGFVMGVTGLSCLPGFVRHYEGRRREVDSWRSLGVAYVRDGRRSDVEPFSRKELAGLRADGVGAGYLFSNSPAADLGEKSFTLGPAFGRPLDEGPHFPADLRKWSEHVRRLAESYDADGMDDLPGQPRIDTFHFGNEMDLFYEVSPLEYAICLRIVYRTVKQADPRAMVVLGASAGERAWLETDHVVGPKKSRLFHVHVLEELARLEKLEGTSKPPQAIPGVSRPLEQEEVALLFSPDQHTRYFDAVDIHFYAAAKECSQLIPYLSQVREVLRKSGYPEDLPLIMGETGTWVGRRAPIMALSDFPIQTERDQAAFLAKTAVTAVSFGCRKYLWFVAVDNPQVERQFRNHTLVNARGEPRLAYWTYRLLAERFGRHEIELAERLREVPNGAVVLRMKHPGRQPFYVAWREPGVAVQAVALSLPTPHARVTSLVPAAASGKEVRDFASAFPVVEKDVLDGKVRVDLAEEPLLVEAAEGMPAAGRSQQDPPSSFGPTPQLHPEVNPQPRRGAPAFSVAAEPKAPVYFLVWDHVHFDEVDSPAERLAFRAQIELFKKYGLRPLWDLGEDVVRTLEHDPESLRWLGQQDFELGYHFHPNLRAGFGAAVRLNKVRDLEWHEAVLAYPRHERARYEVASEAPKKIGQGFHRVKATSLDYSAPGGVPFLEAALGKDCVEACTPMVGAARYVFNREFGIDVVTLDGYAKQPWWSVEWDGSDREQNWYRIYGMYAYKVPWPDQEFMLGRRLASLPREDLGGLKRTLAHLDRSRARLFQISNTGGFPVRELEGVLRYLVEEFLPANPGSRFVTPSWLMEHFPARDRREIDRQTLVAACKYLLENFKAVDWEAELRRRPWDPTHVQPELKVPEPKVPEPEAAWGNLGPRPPRYAVVGREEFLSLNECFLALTRALRAYRGEGKLPARVAVEEILPPIGDRDAMPRGGGKKLSSQEIIEAARAMELSYPPAYWAVPYAIEVEADAEKVRLNAAEMLYAMAAVYADLSKTGTPPATVAVPRAYIVPESAKWEELLRAIQSEAGLDLPISRADWYDMLWLWSLRPIPLRPVPVLLGREPAAGVGEPEREADSNDVLETVGLFDQHIHFTSKTRLEDLIAGMDRTHTRWAVLPGTMFGAGPGIDPVALDDQALGFHRACPKRLFAFTSGFERLDPKESDLKYVQRRLKEGFGGIGEISHPDAWWGGHPVMDRIFRLAALHKVPVNCHMPGEPGRLEAVLARHPDTNFIYTSGWQLLSTRKGFGDRRTPQQMKRGAELLADLLAKHKNLYILLIFLTSADDVRAGIIRDDALAVLRRYPDRFILGSDRCDDYDKVLGVPFPQWYEYMNSVLARLPAESARMIARGNLERLLKINAAKQQAKGSAPTIFYQVIVNCNYFPAAEDVDLNCRNPIGRVKETSKR